MLADQHSEERALKEASPVYRLTVAQANGIDLSLLEDSLAKTPWERMQANDDTLNFAEALRGAMEARNAKP